MTSKPQFDTLLGGNVEPPLEVDTMKFATARAQEIAAISQALEDTNRGKLMFQRLPRHMRRRVMGHNAKRMPRNLREAYTQQLMKSSGASTSKNKTPSRKHRRRPANLLEEYNRRQRQFVWLETHIWHAKRFHMTEQWGYHLALFPNDRSYRACYRASANHCLLQDVSFLCCIEIEGPRQTLLPGLSKHTDSRLGLTFGAQALSDGTREGEVMFYECDKYPWNPVGKVTFFWKPCELSTQEARKLWIWAHPSFYRRILDALISTFQLNPQQEIEKADTAKRPIDDTNAPSAKKIKVEDGKSRDVEAKKLATRNVPFERAPKFLSSCGSVKMVLLKDTLNRFRLTGPLSQAVLKEALQLVDTAGGFSFCKSTPNFDVDEDDQLSPEIGSVLPDAADISSHNLKSHHNFWLSSKGLASPAELPPKMILSLLVKDPRLQIPDKRTKATPTNSGDLSSNASYVVPTPCSNPLWSSRIRDMVSRSKLSTAELNALRSKLLVPGLLRTLENNGGSFVKETSDSKSEHSVNSKIPLILVQRPGSQDPSTKRLGFGCGWDIIFPAGWAMPFWLAFIFRCARSSGLREAASHELESGLCEFLPPDSLAGAEEDSRKGKELRDTYFRLPPDKRPNYIKLGVACPFKCDWYKLVRDWVVVPHEHNGSQDPQTLSPEAEEANKPFFVLRDFRILQEMKQCLEMVWSLFKKGSIGQNVPYEVIMSKLSSYPSQECSLIPVRLEALQKGVTDDLSLICVPLPEDITSMVDGDSTVPVESPSIDHHHDERHKMRIEHKYLLHRLRQQRVRAKKKQEDESSECENLVSKDSKAGAKISPTEDLVSAFKKKMEELWLLDTLQAGSVRNSCSRETAGFVTKGNFSFTEARGCGVGYITFPSFRCLVEVWLKHSPSKGLPHLKSSGLVVLVRSPKSFQYRLAKLSIA